MCTSGMASKLAKVLQQASKVKGSRAREQTHETASSKMTHPRCEVGRSLYSSITKLPSPNVETTLEAVLASLAANSASAWTS